MTKPRGRKGRQGMRCAFNCLCWPWGGAFLLSQGRGYLNLSSPDVHWNQLNVLRYGGIKVTVLEALFSKPKTTSG